MFGNSLKNSKRKSPGFLAVIITSDTMSLEVETEDTGFEFPKILAKLKIMPNQGLNKNTVLSIITGNSFAQF
jgi:hypothetical protein